MKVSLDFGEVIMRGHFFDTEVGRCLYQQLPLKIDLQAWGDEVYGSIGVGLGEERLVSDIPPGGIAYTNKGNYLCFFYGQRPAWPVEHVGELLGGEWEKLRSIKLQAVNITAEK